MERLSVLVVDDDAAIRSLVKAVLVRAGFAVTTARDGCEAIEKLCAADFDAVILDVMMPRLDGFGVIETLQKRTATVVGRILLLTACNLQRLEELPVFGVMHKPFSIPDLIEQTRACALSRTADTDEGILPRNTPLCLGYTLHET